jgi:hypothetical protein
MAGGGVLDGKHSGCGVIAGLMERKLGNPNTAVGIDQQTI